MTGRIIFENRKIHLKTGDARTGGEWQHLPVSKDFQNRIEAFLNDNTFENLIEVMNCHYIESASADNADDLKIQYYFILDFLRTFVQNPTMQIEDKRAKLD